MRKCWSRQIVLSAAVGLGLSCGWAQTRIATLDLKPYGVMTQAELNVQHPIPDPPPERKGYTTSGPPGGIAWSGVGTLAVERAGKIYVGLPIWASGYAPKNAARGTADKFRVLVVNATSGGKVEYTMDFPTKSLGRIALQLAADGTMLVLADDKLMRVGTDGIPTSQLNVPNEQKEFELWGVETSTTGHTLRIWLNDKHTMVVNTKTLAVVKECRTVSGDNDTGTFTDSIELSSQSVAKFPDPAKGLERQAFCEKRERLQQFGQIDFWPAVVNDEQFLAIEEGAMTLRRLSGETVWTSKAPEGLILDTYDDELSRDGSRVALRLMRKAQYHHPDTMNPDDIRNGTWNRTTTEKVEDSVGVWNVASGKLAGVIPLLGHTEGRFFEPNAQIALSPDGKLLAVLEDGMLTVWRMD